MMATNEKDGMGKDDSEDLAASRYDDELLSANWNPVVGLLERSSTYTAPEAARDEPSALREDEIDEFLGRVYRLGN